MSDVELSDDDLLAAEYVVGVLSAEDRVRVQRRMASEPAFAVAVKGWEARLVPMLAEVPEQTPPRVVWMRIAAQLGVTPRPAAGLWHDVRVWRSASAAFAAAAAVAVAVLILSPPRLVTAPTPATPQAAPDITSVAMLRHDTGPIAFVVSVDRDSGRMMIMPIDPTAQTDRSFELWLLPEGQAPVSLGVVNGERALMMHPDEMTGPMGEHGALAISVEPMGGSPTGLPTGPVIATGQLQPI